MYIMQRCILFAILLMMNEVGLRVKLKVIIDVFITSIILYNQVVMIEKNMYSSYNEK